LPVFSVSFVLCVWGLTGNEAPADPVAPGTGGLTPRRTPPLDDHTRALVAAAGVLGVSSPAGAACMLHVSYGSSVWEGLAAKPLEQAPKLVLEGVKDRTGKAYKDSPEGKNYFDVLVLAHQLSAEAFAQSARRDVTFVHLFEDPELYRGEVVHVEGRLTRLRRFEPTLEDRAQGIENVYEGWIFDPDLYGANPMCLVFTDLPGGLQVGEKVDTPVAFDGYFFKRYRYKAGDGWRDSPLLIGHSPVLLAKQAAQPEERGGGLTQNLITVFLSLLVGTVLVTVGLTWWYRRGDRHVRRRLAGTHEIDFKEPEAAEFEPPADAGRLFDDPGGRRLL
jgi:hypothetical protein